MYPYTVQKLNKCCSSYLFRTPLIPLSKFMCVYKKKARETSFDLSSRHWKTPKSRLSHRDTLHHISSFSLLVATALNIVWSTPTQPNNLLSQSLWLRIHLRAYIKRKREKPRSILNWKPLESRLSQGRTVSFALLRTKIRSSLLLQFILRLLKKCIISLWSTFPSMLEAICIFCLRNLNLLRENALQSHKRCFLAGDRKMHAGSTQEQAGPGLDLKKIKKVWSRSESKGQQAQLVQV